LGRRDRGTKFRVKSGTKFVRFYLKTSQAWWFNSVIPAMWEAEVETI
jgi:hypothetical protein